MLTPREIVFRLNGGGDVTPLGAVDVPVVVVVPSVVPRRAGRRVAGGRRGRALGDTSGEKTPPSAYSDRFRP